MLAQFVRKYSGKKLSLKPLALFEPIYALFRTIVFLSSVGASTLIFANSVLIMYPLVIQFDKNRHLLHRIGIVWAKTIVYLNPWWRFKIVGRENLPKNFNPVVYVANHLSQADIIALYILRVRFRWLSKEEIFKVPFMGWAMRAIGYVPVIRGNKRSQTECMRLSKLHLQSGTSMLFFPEGTRSKNGKMSAFKHGAFKLAKECNVPILPISILNSNLLLRKNSFTPQRALVEIIIHSQIDPSHSVESLSLMAQKSIASVLPLEKSSLGCANASAQVKVKSQS